MLQKNIEYPSLATFSPEAVIANVQKEHLIGTDYEKILADLNFEVIKKTPSAEAIELLNNSSMSNTSKIHMLLAALGEKPASTIVIGSKFWSGGDMEEDFPEFEANETLAIAEQLGLKIHTTDHAATNDKGDANWQGRLFCVSLSDNNAALLNKVFWSKGVTDELIVGKILGFPDSATAAYVSEEGMIPFEDQVFETWEDKVFSGFRFSLANSEAEKEVVRRWANSIKEHDTILYNRAYLLS